VTTTAPMGGLPAGRRRRIIIIGLLRALAITAAVVAAYYLLPLDRLAGVPLGFSFVAGLVVLTAMSVYQFRAIINASYPAIRAIEALAATAPLFLVLFAAIYFLTAQADLNNFNVHSLTRTDALYFTVTVFTTVGFGDIVATTQVARLVVTVQMILDLVVLGLGVRVFLGAVQRGRQQKHSAGDGVLLSASREQESTPRHPPLSTSVGFLAHGRLPHQQQMLQGRSLTVHDLQVRWLDDGPLGGDDQ
jgi:voltage-gated potassium channel